MLENVVSFPFPRVGRSARVEGTSNTAPALVRRNRIDGRTSAAWDWHRGCGEQKNPALALRRFSAEIFQVALVEQMQAHRY